MTIGEIRTEIETHVKKPLKITIHGSRNRVENYTGIITETYPSVFVVEIDVEGKQFERKSYNYIDVLTGTILIEYM